jgi:hypothetical protein
LLSFEQRLALFHRVPHKAHALNGRGYTPGFYKSMYFMTLELAGMVCGGGLSLLYTQKFSKIAAIHATAWRFGGTEGLVKMNFCVKGYEKSKDTAFYYF